MHNSQCTIINITHNHEHKNIRSEEHKNFLDRKNVSAENRLQGDDFTDSRAGVSGGMEQGLQPLYSACWQLRLKP